MAERSEPDNASSDIDDDEQDVSTMPERGSFKDRRTTHQQMEVIVRSLQGAFKSDIIDIVPQDQSQSSSDTGATDDESSPTAEGQLPPVLTHRTAFSRAHLDQAISKVAKVSLWVGMSIALSLLTFSSFLLRDVANNADKQCASHLGKTTMNMVMRPAGWLGLWGRFGDLVLFYYLWGFALYIMGMCGIDHVAVMKNSPLVSRSKMDALEGAAKAMIIWCLGRHVFVQVAQCDPALSWLRPEVSWVLGLTYVLFFAHLFYMMGCTVPKLVLGALASPFSAKGPQGIDGFTGNWLSSLSKPMVSVGYAVCLYASRDVFDENENSSCYEAVCGAGVLAISILCFGNAVRMAQLFRQFYDSGKVHPHLTNTFKYFLSLCVTLGSYMHQDSTHRALWRSLTFVSIIYSFVWDVTMDWGLLETTRAFLCLPCGRVSLRPYRLLSKHKAPYIIAIILNFLARITWVSTLIPLANMEFMSGTYKLVRVVWFVSPTVEIMRRMMWTLLMMEYRWLDALEKAGDTGAMGLVRTMNNRRSNIGTQAVSGRYLKVEFSIALVLAIGMPILIVVMRV